MEPLHKTIIRHLREGELNGTTIKKGLAALKDRVEAFHESQAELVSTNEELNYRGISGLDVVTYNLIVPPLNPLYARKKSEWGDARFEFVSFPVDSVLKIYAVSIDDFSEAEQNDREDLTTNRYLAKIPNAIASFTGPTFTAFTDYLPNNGFFYRGDETARVKFEDTFPSGLRRGAIGVTSNQRTVLLNDAEKWAAVRSDFSGFDALVGTSCYFTDKDSVETLRVLTDNSRGKVSYLIKYLTQEEEERLVFAVSARATTTATIKNLMDLHLAKLEAQSYFAVELELNSANCVTKNPQGITREVNSGGFSRRDHYLIERATPTTPKK